MCNEMCLQHTLRELTAVFQDSVNHWSQQILDILHQTLCPLTHIFIPLLKQRYLFSHSPATMNVQPMSAPITNPHKGFTTGKVIN